MAPRFDPHLGHHLESAGYVFVWVEMGPLIRHRSLETAVLI